MERKRRSNAVIGILLILMGLACLVVRMLPGIRVGLNMIFSWPIIIITVGAALFIFGLLIGEPDMAIPSCIVGGIGVVLYWQNLTGYWESWSYIWTLIPGFVGAGITLASIIKGNRKEIKDGLQLILISAVLFLVFGGFFGAFPPLSKYWPLLLVFIGLWQLGQTILRTRR